LSFRAYFVSDLHLKSKEERSAQIFVRFLKRLQDEQQLTHLFLLGDIFDFWVSDHSYFIEKFHPIVEEIDRITRRGIEVHYFEGNHDLHLERYWYRKLV
jgi:UDP-2,3-diacylglucosamine hydrolase